MAKVSFTKLGLKQNQEVVEIHHNDQVIEVLQYLPIDQKLEIIEHVINKSANENNFADPTKVKMFIVLELVDYYTNINFTDKQKESPQKLFDLLAGSGLANKIVNAIPSCEYQQLNEDLWETIDSVYKYRNSVMGILDIISQDYSNLNLDATNIQKSLSDPDNMNGQQNHKHL